MITPFDIYLIGTIGGFKNSLLGFGLIGFLLLVIPGGICLYENDIYDSPRGKTKKWFVGQLVISLLMLTTANLIPSPQTLAAMYVIPALATPAIEKLPQNAAKLADEWMKEKAKEIAESSK
ncbi:hypothetical protein [Nitrospira sp. BLG_2]|uniref:hypothetical protein n=1 Tax=Nitrospira sp. BLG_2 TaxID=3397507 RepID=UPI003B9AFD30